ncbi:MAG: (deoxy)nucleoside triphosphate pyrophosphohydrolase [Acidobacteria bacterium]|nr:(deoxy)nucleoside triphosphate pyrophosphohydrolase [Acidobacteriota bacterium]MBI3279945.1 (deoxy)nucleoside triphosphate pyrophosphohydrolase [Acidobacteriota bacterium]
MSRVVRVVAALIEDKGKVLIGQRRKNDTHPLKWEFPGGKIEQGESARIALARELREELGIEAIIGPCVGHIRHSYGRRATVQLLFFRVAQFSGTPVNHAFEQIAWDAPERLPEYDFLAGDVEFVRRLANGHGQAASSLQNPEPSRGAATRVSGARGRGLRRPWRDAQ